MNLLLKIIIALFIVGLCAYFFSDFLLEFWWFSSLQLGSFFLLRESYAGLVSIATTIIFAALAYMNLAAIPRALGVPSGLENKGVSGLLLGHRTVLWLLSLAIVIPVLIPVYTHWESFLLYYFSASSELVDPVYGKNISYYFGYELKTGQKK